MITAWSALEETYGRRFAADVLTVLPGVAKDAKTAVARVMTFLAGAEEPGLQRLREAYRRPSAGRRADGADAIVDLLDRWLRHGTSIETLTAVTTVGYARSFIKVASRLGRLSGRSYPAFDERSYKLPAVVGSIPTFGSFDWPELADCDAHARDMTALALVRNSASTEFERMEAIYWFGQSFLDRSGCPPDTDPHAWAKVAEYMALAEKRLRAKGYEAKVRLRRDMARLLNRNLLDGLLAAGLPASLVEDVIDKRPDMFSREGLTAALLGPTVWTTMAVATVLACETGWNRQTIMGMPRDPFAVRMSDGFGLSPVTFVESNKGRTNKLMRSALGLETAISRMEAENAMAVWLQVVGEKANTTVNGARRFDEGSGAMLFDVLRRYQRCADRFRAAVDGSAGGDGRFLMSLRADGRLNGDPERLYEPSLRAVFPELVLGRAGVDFRSVRKTYLNVAFQRLGSAGAAAHEGGHSGARTVFVSYLTSEAVKFELDASVRFFQKLLESVLHRGDGREGRLGSPPGEYEWFARLARVSGLLAAFGLVDLPEKTMAPRFDFGDDPAHLEELYLLHRSLTAARGTVGLSRWQIQGLPLLGLTKAIGAVIIKENLRRRYYRAARNACRKLARGEASLPIVLDVANIPVGSA